MPVLWRPHGDAVVGCETGTPLPRRCDKPEHGLHLDRRHHEAYRNDVRQVAPDKLRIVFRQSVSPLWSQTRLPRHQAGQSRVSRRMWS